MLGEEHKAECSICMDEVNIGEQVTELPCKHWFHHQCVSAWLLEHDTCPHCRKGITKDSEGRENNPASPGREDRTSQMPGSFIPSGSGTLDDPYTVPASSPGPPSNNQSNSSDNVNAGSGGISDRIRRGLFGSPQ
jgi:E3 ubiquitin-protein ligase RNF115/126